VPLSFPADPTTGAGLDALDTNHVLMVGGTTSAGGTAARVLDLSCTSACTPSAWTASIPTALVFVQVFAIDAQSAFVVGEDAGGAMHAYRVTSATAQEVAFRVPRSHARAVRLPTGPIAVVGGDPNIESFAP
jgi:hypothetical protein